MKKKLMSIFLIVIVMVIVAGCATQAEKASYNVSKEADNFNVVRQLTVIDCITGDVLFQMTGKISIQPDPAENQLEIIVEDEYGDYQKHFVGLSDNVTYVVEQKQSKDVSNYRYTLNFNPEMWFPVDVKVID
jgi:outer membrane lipoprotein-sorting protein